MRIGRFLPCQQTRYLQHTNGIRNAKIITHASEEIILASPGTRCSLKVHRFGSAGARPKAYLYAALHADKWPGQLTPNHLNEMLEESNANKISQGRSYCSR